MFYHHGQGEAGAEKLLCDMEKLTSIWQIDEKMVEAIAELSAVCAKDKGKQSQPLLTYQEKLERLFKTYISILKSYTHRDDGISLWEERDIKFYVNDKLIRTIRDLFDKFSRGKLTESNKCSNRLFNVSANRQTAKSLFPITNIPKDSFWFRARRPERIKFSRKDLFHVPFEKRGFIGTNRFSILGYPCLYLASTIVGAREETEDSKDLGITAISCFQNNTDIEAYDFTFFPKRKKEDWQTLYKDIMTYPFKIAASIPVGAEKEYCPFKEEYIIPQLLLHCVIRQSGKRKLALLYSSTKAIENKVDKNLFCQHANLVFPAVLVKRDGFCRFLMEKFILTSPQIVPFTHLSNEEINEIEKNIKQMKMENLNQEID